MISRTDKCAWSDCLQKRMLLRTKCTEASMDPRDVEIKSQRPSYFMLTCLGIPRHDDKKYVSMST